MFTLNNILDMARGVGWVITSQMISRLAGFMSSLALARLMGIDEFGEYVLLLTTLMMLQAFAVLGLGTTATKYVAELRHNRPRDTGTIIVFCLIVGSAFGLALSILLILFAPELSQLMLDNQTIAVPLAVCATALLFLVITAITQGAIAGFQAFSELARLNAVTGIASLLILPAGAYIGGLLGVSAAFVALNLATAALSMFSLTSICRVNRVPLSVPRCNAWAIVEGIFWRFSAPTALLGFLVWPTQWICNTLLAKQGTHEVAVFYAASQIANAVLMLTEALGQVALPLFSARNKVDQAALLLQQSTSLGLAITLPCVVTIALFGEVILGLFGKAYSSSSETLILLLGAVIVVATQTSAGKFLQAKGAAIPLLLAGFAWSLAQIVSFWVFSDGKSSSLAAARLFAFSFHTLMLVLILKRQIKQREAPDV